MTPCDQVEPDGAIHRLAGSYESMMIEDTSGAGKHKLSDVVGARWVEKEEVAAL